jgi:alkyl hydroperoxide reductase subunit AhpF
MRKNIVAGNWKMNKTLQEGIQLAEELNEALKGKTVNCDVDGVFIQIGLAPNSSVFKGVVNVNRFGEIETDSHCRTNVPGIYAAGDVTTVPYKQIIISMGEGAKAALTAFDDRIRGVLS